MPQVAITLAITAGSMALQYLMRPKIKQQPLDKGKMDDIRIQGSDYGAFIPRLLSGKARMAGNIVFSSGVIDYVSTTGGSSGGKKAGGAPVETTHTYVTSLGVLLCESQIQSFLRIWAGTNLLYNGAALSTSTLEAEGSSATRTGGASISTSGTFSGTGYVTGLGAGGKVTFNTSGIPNPALPKGGENLVPATRVSFIYKCSADKTATSTSSYGETLTLTLPNTSGAWTPNTQIFQTFVNSVTFENASTATADLDYIFVQKFWATDDSLAPGYDLTGVANPNLSYPSKSGDPSEYYNYSLSAVKNGTTGTYTMEGVAPGMITRFYTGTETQTQDSKLVEWLDAKFGTGQGVNYASAMRGMTWAMFQDYTLKQSSPDNFTFELDKGTNTLNEALVILFGDVNIGSSLYDISATSTYTQYGLLETQAMSRRQYIENLERYHFFRLGEIDGKVRTIADTFTSSGTISQTNLRAHMDGESMPDHDADCTIAEEHLLPRKVIVNFNDPDLEYHNNAVESQLFADMVATETVEYSFPIIDTAANAKQRAERLLLKSWAEANEYQITVMPTEGQYAIGDVITVPVGGNNIKMRIEKKTMPLPIGPITYSCVAVNPFTPINYQDDVSTTAPKRFAQYSLSTFPRNSVIFPIQSVPIRNQDRARCGVYLAACGSGRGNGTKIGIYRETDADDYVLQTTLEEQSLMGLCAGTLANWAGGTATIDTTNTLDIWFFNDINLETITDADIARFPLSNLIRIGSEWVQFKTAVAQTLETNSPYRSKWRISNLWRGRFNTSSTISTHAASEYAAVYSPSMIFFDLEREDIGQTVNLKAVTEGQGIDVAPICSFTFNTNEVITAVASETITAPAMVNLFLSGGVLKVQKANATNNTKPCDGYILRDVTSGSTGMVYTEEGSLVRGWSGLTIGSDYYLSTTGGAITTTAPSSTGNIVQKVGKAISSSVLAFRSSSTKEKA